jgi:hypothetical protein
LAGLAAPALSILLTSVAGAAAAFALDRLIQGLEGFLAGGLVGGVLVCVLLWMFDRRFDLNLRLLVSKALPAAAGAFGRAANGPAGRRETDAARS